MPSARELEKNKSLIMFSSDGLLGYPQAKTPNIIQLGPLHIVKPKPLPAVSRMSWSLQNQFKDWWLADSQIIIYLLFKILLSFKQYSQLIEKPLIACLLPLVFQTMNPTIPLVSLVVCNVLSRRVFHKDVAPDHQVYRNEYLGPKF